MRTRVLVVDDDPAVLQCAGTALAGLGYEVETTHDPREALLLYREAEPAFDLVVTDFSMPHLNGLELVQEMKRAPGESLFLMITAEGPGLTPSQLRTAGIHRVLAKPFTATTLAAIVQSALG